MTDSFSVSLLISLMCEFSSAFLCESEFSCLLKVSQCNHISEADGVVLPQVCIGNVKFGLLIVANRFSFFRVSEKVLIIRRASM